MCTSSRPTPHINAVEGAWHATGGLLVGSPPTSARTGVGCIAAARKSTASTLMPRGPASAINMVVFVLLLLLLLFAVGIVDVDGVAAITGVVWARVMLAVEG